MCPQAMGVTRSLEHEVYAASRVSALRYSDPVLVEVENEKQRGPSMLHFCSIELLARNLLYQSEHKLVSGLLKIHVE